MRCATYCFTFRHGAGVANIFLLEDLTLWRKIHDFDLLLVDLRLLFVFVELPL